MNSRCPSKQSGSVLLVGLVLLMVTTSGVFLANYLIEQHYAIVLKRQRVIEAHFAIAVAERDMFERLAQIELDDPLLHECEQGFCGLSQFQQSTNDCTAEAEFNAPEVPSVNVEHMHFEVSYRGAFRCFRHTDGRYYPKLRVWYLVTWKQEEILAWQVDYEQRFY